MDKETLDKVLSLLAPDPEQAAIEYRKLHERLTRFFEWNSTNDPTALADEALDRLGKRAGADDLEHGVRSASAFVLGVARHLLQEERRRQARDAQAQRVWISATTGPPSPEIERMDAALQHALAHMKPDRRKLIQAYYGRSGAQKIKAHQDLAIEYGLSLNALRNRVLRLRKELEASVRRYLAEQSE